MSPRMVTILVYGTIPAVLLLLLLAVIFDSLTK